MAEEWEDCEVFNLGESALLTFVTTTARATHVLPWLFSQVMVIL